MPEKKTDEKPDASVAAAKEVGADQVQAYFDDANEKGYFGEVPEGTPPNEDLTLRGVTRKG